MVTDRALSPGQKVEVLIGWPVNRVGVKIVVLCEVVRVETERATYAAVRIDGLSFAPSHRRRDG